jgi:hypothetical protein
MAEKIHAMREFGVRSGRAGRLPWIGVRIGVLALAGLSGAEQALATHGRAGIESFLLLPQTEESDAILAEGDEVQITDEMIEAGEVALLGYDPRFGNLDAVARKVFEAMEKARRRGGHGTEGSRR